MMAISIEQNTSHSASGVKKDAVEAFAKSVDTQMLLDNSYPELSECLKMGGATLPTVSGLNDHDYPGISELGISLQSLAQPNIVKRIPLPPELVEQFGFLQSNCQMGLFPEIGRAWLTIDSNLFVWSFYDGSDLAYYDGLKETILCVGFVKPKPGVFQSCIHCLICLTTPAEIVILGANFTRQNENSSPFEEMHLLPEPLFSYPTDNVHMCTFEGTDCGRIFFGGKDGSVYEFAYQAQDSWFSSCLKCRKINHSSSSLSFLVPSFLSLAFLEDDAVLQVAVDNSRHILYARLEKGSIQVFDLGKDGKQMSKVHILHQHAIIQQASDIARTIDKKNFYPVVYISPIEATESKFVHLLAITQSGVRLYYTTNGGFGDNRPYTLALLHVRLPPGFTANASVQRPLNVHMAYYKKGFTLLSSSQKEENDDVFATSNDSFAFLNQLIESHTTVMLDGRAWAIAEAPTILPLPEPVKPTDIICDPPVLVTQHRDPMRQFVFLNTQGSFILRKPRPVDQLYKLLLDNKGPDTDAVKSFMIIHKDHAIVMCLILACSPTLQDKQVAEWANRAFFMYGGEPGYGTFSTGDSPIRPNMSTTLNQSSSLTLPTVWASTPQNQHRAPCDIPQPQFSTMYSPVHPVNTPARNRSALTQQASSPTVQSVQQAQSTTTEIVFSRRHNGLYLYFSRILRPLWNRKIVCENSKVVDNSKLIFLDNNIPMEDLVFILQQILALKQFLQNNEHAFLKSNVVTSLAKSTGVSRFVSQAGPNSAGATDPIHYQRRNQSDAEVQERISLVNYVQLVNYTYEVLALWKVLNDHQFPSVLAFLPQSLTELLKVFTFKEFLIEGKELLISLTNALINFYLEDNASTGAISQRLRDLCPSIYRIEDATVSRAQEMVLLAKHCANKNEKEKQLWEALKLCKSIAPHVDLEVMCGMFRDAGFYRGIIDLCLCCAGARDPQALALYFYRNGEPQDDAAGSCAFLARMKCYKNVIDSMNILRAQSMLLAQSSSVPKEPGPPSSRDPSKLSPEEAKIYSEQILEISLKTDDEIFHVALYNWFIENNETDTLLSVRSHFLEDYLKRCSQLRPDNLYVLNLLWKYYEKNHNFSAAARVLAKLADKDGVEMNLSQRVEYLSRAIMCVKGSEMRISTSGEGEFLHELEEKMEVARIQLQLLEALQLKKNTLKTSTTNQLAVFDEAINSLNCNFQGIQELYEEYALRFDIPESQLALVQCGGLDDPALIEQLWQSIIEKEMIATVGNMPETRVKILHEKLVRICQAYVNSEKYFPIYFIIKLLESRSCSLNLDPTWVFKFALSLGVNIVELLKMYHKLQGSRDPCWNTAGRPLHVFRVLEQLIGFFAESPAIVPLNERRSFITFCLDVISGYLVDLQAMDSAIPSVPILIKNFKSVQRKLEMKSAGSMAD